MYERNAIVISRWFSNEFGYNENVNLKTNYGKYCELVNKLGKYKEICEDEDNIMKEYEKIATEIKEIQRRQEMLEKKDNKLKESRKRLFENIDEPSDILKKKFDKIEDEIKENSEEIKETVERFVGITGVFIEKSQIRDSIGKERRVIENEYQRALSNIIKSVNALDIEKLREAKLFLKQEDFRQEHEIIKQDVLKNGEKEKIPFDENVISKAIDFSIDIEAKKIQIFVNAYEKTVRLLEEIKNDTVKVEKYKKIVKESEIKLKFLNTISEYIILFLDNERMSIASGKEEHQRVMNEASENFEKDIEQIKNLYEIINKEVAGKATKKLYKELYSPEYLQELKYDEIKFEKRLSKINLIGTVIYPNYWRIEGIQKAYDTFKEIIEQEYNVDLSEYEPIELKPEDEEDINELIIDVNEDNLEEENYEKTAIENNIRRKRKEKYKELTAGFDDKLDEDLKVEELYANLKENNILYTDIDDYELEDEQLEVIDEVDDKNFSKSFDYEELEEEDKDKFSDEESLEKVDEDDLDENDLDEDDLDEDDLDEDDLDEDDLDEDDLDENELDEAEFDEWDKNYDDEKDEKFEDEEFENEEFEDDFIDDDSEWDDAKREAKRDRDIDEILGFYNTTAEEDEMYNVKYLQPMKFTKDMGNEKNEKQEEPFEWEEEIKKEDSRKKTKSKNKVKEVKEKKAKKPKAGKHSKK